jgi:hypothetical protein
VVKPAGDKAETARVDGADQLAGTDNGPIEFARAILASTELGRPAPDLSKVFPPPEFTALQQSAGAASSLGGGVLAEEVRRYQHDQLHTVGGDHRGGTVIAYACPKAVAAAVACMAVCRVCSAVVYSQLT